MRYFSPVTGYVGIDSQHMAHKEGGWQAQLLLSVEP